MLFNKNYHRNYPIFTNQSRKKRRAKKEQKESKKEPIRIEYLPENVVKENYKEEKYGIGSIYPIRVCAICEGTVFDHNVCIRCLNLHLYGEV